MATAETVLAVYSEFRNVSEEQGTGKLDEIERLMSSLEGDRWKRSGLGTSLAVYPTLRTVLGEPGGETPLGYSPGAVGSHPRSP